MTVLPVGLVALCLTRICCGRRVQTTVWQGVQKVSNAGIASAVPNFEIGPDGGSVVDDDVWSRLRVEGNADRSVNSTRHLLFSLNSATASRHASSGVLSHAIVPHVFHGNSGQRVYAQRPNLLGFSRRSKDPTSSDSNVDSNDNADIPSSGTSKLNLAGRILAFATAAISLPFMLSRKQLSVVIVLVAAFLNLLGFTMAGPITPALGAHFGLDVGASLGWLTSAYPFGMLFGLVFWPSLSDRIGRKPVIALSLFGSGAGLLIQGLAVRQHWALTTFLCLRAITGSMAGASPVAKAYLADVGSASGQLPRYMSWRDAASSLAFIVGPLLSGTLYLGKKAVGLGQARSLSAVIASSGIYSILASILVLAFVSETPSTSKVPTDSKSTGASTAKDNSAKQSRPEATDRSEGTDQCPLGSRLVTAVATICVVSALFNLGSAPFDAFFPSLLKDVGGLDEIGIGNTKASLATLSFLISATLCASTQRRFGTVFTCFLGLCASAVGLAGLAGVAAYGSVLAISSSAKVVLFWIAAAIYQIGIPLLSFSIPTMLLECVPRDRRGAVMGLDSSINAVARIVSAPVLGALYAFAGPGFCFGTASVVLFLSAALVLVRRFLVKRG